MVGTATLDTLDLGHRVITLPANKTFSLEDPCIILTSAPDWFNVSEPSQRAQQ